MDGLVNDGASLIEPEDVIADRARAARLHLVLVPEQLHPGSAAAVVEIAVSENAEQGRLAGIDVADDSDSVKWQAMLESDTPSLSLTHTHLLSHTDTHSLSHTHIHRHTFSHTHTHRHQIKSPTLYP